VSPFQAHWGRWRYTCLLQPSCLFTVHVGSVPSHISSGAFLTQPLLQAFPVQGCWVGATTPAFSGQLVYLKFCEGFHPHFGAQGTPPSLLHVFFCCCLLFSLVFFSFFPGWGQSVQEAMLMWPRVVCGSTTCRFAHLVVCVSQAGRSWCLAAWSSPGFSV
jgi:hypothetical protein